MYQNDSIHNYLPMTQSQPLPFTNKGIFGITLGVQGCTVKGWIYEQYKISVFGRLPFP